MAAGVIYNINPMAVEKELCNQKTIYRLAGGFNLVDSALNDGSTLPAMTPLAVDFKTRKAVACKNMRVVEAVTDTAKTIKVAKRSLAYIGMFIGTGTKGAEVSAIDKTKEGYDTITVKATLGEAVKANQVIFEALAVDGLEQKNTANFLNCASTKVEAGATVTAIGQVFEIKEELLPCPVSEKDKENLGARFMFV